MAERKKIWSIILTFWENSSILGHCRSFWVLFVVFKEKNKRYGYSLVSPAVTECLSHARCSTDTVWVGWEVTESGQWCPILKKSAVYWQWQAERNLTRIAEEVSDGTVHPEPWNPAESCELCLLGRRSKKESQKVWHPRRTVKEEWAFSRR